jgi:hypothetical protein
VTSCILSVTPEAWDPTAGGADELHHSFDVEMKDNPASGSSVVHTTAGALAGQTRERRDPHSPTRVGRASRFLTLPQDRRKPPGTYGKLCDLICA